MIFKLKLINPYSPKAWLILTSIPLLLKLYINDIKMHVFEIDPSLLKYLNFVAWVKLNFELKFLKHQITYCSIQRITVHKIEPKKGEIQTQYNN